MDEILKEMPLRAVEIDLQVRIEATPGRVWYALIEETTLWWPRDFYANPRSQDFIIEAHIGGRMFEDATNGAGYIWADIRGVDPERSLDLVGQLTPRFGGPATSILRFELEPDGDATLFTVQDASFGALSDDMEDKIRLGWQILIEKSLKPYLEKI